MAKQRKTILTAAVTGAIHTPTMSPYLPKGIEGIINDAVAAAEAGASMVHIHARKDNGQPTSDIQALRQILSGIKERSDVVIGISTGGAIGMSIEERLAVIPEFQPEIASCNAGTTNFVLSELAKGMDNPLYDWEVPFLKGTYAGIFKNTFADMEYCIQIMNDSGTRPEFEVFDLGQISNLAYFLKKGLIKKPIYIQFVLGVMGGAPLTIDNLIYFTNTAKNLLGSDIQYSIVAGGRRLFRYSAFNAVYGGNCRVGMEDSLYISGAGELAEGSAQQVAKMSGILQSLDFEIASPDEAREMLQLKGKDQVKF